MKKGILYLHGKGGSAQEAAHYTPICRDYDVIGLDYRGTTPWETEKEILAAFEALHRQYGGVSVIANSIGAYFAMNALSETAVERAFFISPIVNMEKLICDMMTWAGVTERELADRQEIPTAFGETLSWKYLCYVREHPIAWHTPTDILYAGGDNLTSYETVSAFAKETNATLQIMPEGEHWFHTKEQLAFLDRWLTERISCIADMFQTVDRTNAK